MFKSLFLEGGDVLADDPFRATLIPGPSSSGQAQSSQSIFWNHWIRIHRGKE